LTASHVGTKGRPNLKYLMFRRSVLDTLGETGEDGVEVLKPASMVPLENMVIMGQTQIGLVAVFRHTSHPQSNAWHPPPIYR
jgi:hypothetical protein